MQIHWFRQDLRLSDNPAFVHAVKQGAVLPIYIHDTDASASHHPGAASKVWLHHSLTALNKRLDGCLNVYMGNPLEIIDGLIKQHDVRLITWNRCYEPGQIKLAEKVKQHCSANDITAKSFNGSLLWEPWEVHKSNGEPYKVFTPFYTKGCLSVLPPRKPLLAPKTMTLKKDKAAVTIVDLKLLPDHVWAADMIKSWEVGEEAASNKMRQFINDGLKQYKKGRDFPAMNAVSRLSPHLHFGEISPNTLWYALSGRQSEDNAGWFLRELAWREFSYSQLYYNQHLSDKNLNPQFDYFEWKKDSSTLSAWKKGMTGYPIVDAGMRELWQTGYMHNRVRMIVASFLVKNLLLDWRQGERWFWDCLVDADLANNSASWQWVAGSGADAAPYFRIFNPILQGEKFDAQGDYVRKYVKELKDLPDKYLFHPWDAPQSMLDKAHVELGVTYPKPIVELKFSRERALAAYKAMREQWGGVKNTG